MLLNEFIERTGFQPDADEWDAINIVYTNSEVDKDTFCSIWCKMNPSRVRQAKEDDRRRADESERNDFLYELLHERIRGQEYDEPARDFFGIRRYNRLLKYGLKINEKTTVWDCILKIKNLLGIKY